MCRKFVLGSTIDTIQARFNLSAQKLYDLTPKIIVSPGEETLIISQENPGQIMLSTFGMTPVWAKRPMQFINARSEGDKNPDNNPDFKGSKAIFLKPAFQKPLFHRRCIVIADAFLEWSFGMGSKPYLFFLRDHERPFGMAGLYDIWSDPLTRERHHSFTIITVPANSLVRRLPAARMPVILPRGTELSWLRETNSLAEVLNKMQRYPSAKMNTYPISNEINNPPPYSKDILQPLGDCLLSEDKLLIPPMRRYYEHKKHSEGTNTWFNQT
jgi:putative SOS response-associated peptidase YedK